MTLLVENVLRNPYIWGMVCHRADHTVPKFQSRTAQKELALRLSTVLGWPGCTSMRGSSGLDRTLGARGALAATDSPAPRFQRLRAIRLQADRAVPGTGQ